MEINITPPTGDKLEPDFSGKVYLNNCRVLFPELYYKLLSNKNKMESYVKAYGSGLKYYQELFGDDPMKYENKLIRTYLSIDRKKYSDELLVSPTGFNIAIYDRIERLFEFHRKALPKTVKRFSDLFGEENKDIAAKILDEFQGEDFATIVRIAKHLKDEVPMIDWNNKASRFFVPVTSKQLTAILIVDFNLKKGTPERFSTILDDYIEIDKEVLQRLETILQGSY